MNQKYLILDFETYSEADLKRVGGYEYSCHPSTEIICVAWTLGTRGGKWTEVKCSNNDYYELVKLILDNRIIKVAHNAIFEQSIIKNVLGRAWSSVTDIPPEEFMCTAAMAASHALPRNLEGACLSLDLPIKKDMEGRKLILKWCKPRKPTLKNPSRRHTKPKELARIMQYCATDVEAERLLFERLPLLNPIERKVWCLDQKINFKGFAVDRPLVDAVLKMVETETENLTEELIELTDGRVQTANERAKLLVEIERNGIHMPDLKAKTVQDTLEAGITANPTAMRLLQIRQAVSKTSTAKYAAFESRSRTDSRCRDILVYHAASTGRWGGAGVQPQNFPRGTIKNTDLACEILRTGELGLVRACYDDPMSAFSSALRGVIIPTEGTELFCADYAAIETRVLFWIADHEEGLNAFRENRDLYKEMASIIYGVPVGAVTSLMRQLGKAAVLGCGYQMGAAKFVASCKLQRIDVEEDTAKSAVKAYRSTHHPVVTLWSTIAEAAIRAVQRPHKRFFSSHNHTTWFVEDDFLFCELPSGRRLAYYKPEVRWEATPWGDQHPKLYHYSVNPLSKKWELAATYGGKLVENVIQAVARDLMAEAMLRIDEAGFEIVLSVHDEIVAEAPIEDARSVREFENLMATNPEWAAGMPVKVEGWKGFRYRK